MHACLCVYAIVNTCAFGLEFPLRRLCEHCQSVCVCVCVGVGVCVCVCVCVCSCVSTGILGCKHTCAYPYAHIDTDTGVSGCLDVCVSVCVCVCVCLCVCVCETWQCRSVCCLGIL